MKILTKTGRAEFVKSKALDQGESIVCFELGGVKFKEVLLADQVRFKDGDALYVEYETNGVSNKILCLKKLSGSKSYAVFFAFWSVLGIYFACGLASGLLNGAINFNGPGGLLGLLFFAPVVILSLKRAADKLKILRLLQESERRFEK